MIEIHKCGPEWPKSFDQFTPPVNNDNVVSLSLTLWKRGRAPGEPVSFYGTKSGVLSKRSAVGTNLNEQIAIAISIGLWCSVLSPRFPQSQHECWNNEQWSRCPSNIHFELFGTGSGRSRFSPQKSCNQWTQAGVRLQVATLQWTGIDKQSTVQHNTLKGL